MLGPHNSCTRAAYIHSRSFEYVRGLKPDADSFEYIFLD
jgi:hypothetical protein